MTRMVAALALLGSSTLVLAQAPKWVETGAWSGTGTGDTPSFTVVGTKCNVRCVPKGHGPIRVVVCSEDGEERVVVTDQKGKWPISAHETFQDMGVFHVKIQANEALDWNLTVKQRLRVIQEWELVQEAKKQKPPVTVAAWTGQGPETSVYKLRIKQGSWRLARQFAGQGTLKVVVKDSDGAEVARSLVDNTAEQVCWIHRTGEFTVEVTGSPGVQWKVTAAREQT